MKLAVACLLFFTVSGAAPAYQSDAPAGPLGARASPPALPLTAPGPPWRASGDARAPGQKTAAKPAPARVVFIKEFPGSSPAYYSVSVSEEGEAIYATAPDDSDPIRFRLPPAVLRQVFETVERLNYFQDAQLETRKKVANMGKKTLRYEGGGRRNEASFNYSENLDAMTLAGLFEKISITERHLLDLERLAHFDRLGVNQELLQIEISMNRMELVEPTQFVPLLEEIAGDSRFLHMAQERARHLLERIKATPTDK